MRMVMRLFPRWWRLRYGDEFLALLEDQPSAWRRSLDVWRCLVRAHLDHAGSPFLEPTPLGGGRLAAAVVNVGVGLAGLGFAFLSGASYTATSRAISLLAPLVMIVPLAVVLAVLKAARRHGDHPLRALMPSIAADAFLATSLGLLAVATLPPQLGFFASPAWIELRPFYDVLNAATDAARASAIAVLAGNAFLFTTFGFAFALRRGRPGFFVLLAVAVAIAIALEIGQALLGTGRPTDVSVVIARAAGAALGYSAWRLVWPPRRSGQIRGPGTSAIPPG
jgi:hypothetical protein